MARFQFSLSRFLVLVAIAAVSLSYVLISRDLQQTQTELRQVKNKFGELHVTSPKFLHAIETPLSEPDACHWRWQAHLPTDKKWRLRAKIGGQIPRFGIPKNSYDTRGAILGISGGDESNTVLVDVRVSPLPEGGIALTLEDGISRTTLRLPQEHFPVDKLNWLFDPSGGLTDLLAGNHNETAVHTTDTPFFLLVYRQGITAAGGTTQNANPTGGLVVWIEEAAAP